MPILLNDLTKTTPIAQSTKTYSPKFFDDVLTGSGKKIGLLNDAVNPEHIPSDFSAPDTYIAMPKYKYVNGNTKTQFIPFYIIAPIDWDSMEKIPLPDVKTLTKIGEDKKNRKSLYISMRTNSIVVETTTNNYGGKNSNEKYITLSYQLFFYTIENNTTEKTVNQTNQLYTPPISGNFYYTHFSVNPKKTFLEAADVIKADYNIDTKAIYDFIANYDTYQAICERSKEWQEDIHNTLDVFFENQAKGLSNSAPFTNAYILSHTYKTLRALENHNVPLDRYKEIYKSVVKHFPNTEVSALCKQNLSLLLSDTLRNLDANKKQLTTFTPKKKAKIDPKFSDEQKAAITTPEPLVMVQSVAGSGKSSVVLARIKYMIDSGVNPKDITVLSFTNAAANNIMNKNPGVNAYTIAKMIHEIYSLNYKTHELSSIDTMINALNIYYPHDDLAKEFRKGLLAVKKNDNNSFTNMNNFIEEHFDEVLAILDTLKQTTLELEIMICYQRIETLQEPSEIQSKFLIIDEVQDNSVFEFIYTLKYCDKHKVSLFIVGRL